jgi:hypothetical protein
LEHTTQFPLQPFEWENKKQEKGAYKCVDKGGRCDNNCMDSRNERMWTLNNTTTIGDESVELAQTIPTPFKHGVPRKA